MNGFIFNQLIVLIVKFKSQFHVFNTIWVNGQLIGEIACFLNFFTIDHSIMKFHGYFFHFLCIIKLQMYACSDVHGYIFRTDDESFHIIAHGKPNRTGRAILIVQVTVSPKTEPFLWLIQAMIFFISTFPPTIGIIKGAHANSSRIYQVAIIGNQPIALLF